MTLFHLFVLIGLALGITLGWSSGHHFGIGGRVLGAAVGGFLGFWLGQIPWFFANWYFTRQLNRKSTEQLWQELYDPACLAPNMLLRTLARCGESMEVGLDYVLSLLVSEDRHQRSTGLAALFSVFPEIANKLGHYRVDMPDAERHEVVARLRASLANNKQAADN